MVKKELKAVAYFTLIVGIITLFLGAISLSGTGASLIDFFRALAVQFGFVLLGVLTYSSTLFAGNFLGLGKNKLFHVISGIGIGIVYILASNFLPGFSIAIPLLPASIISISSGLQKFIVIGVAPVVETVFFLGVILGLLRKRFSLTISVFIQALIFASFHIGAYIIGLYDYSASQGFLGLASNLSVFFSAFIFGIFSGYLVSAKKWKGLLVAIVIHAIINLFTILKFSIIIGTIFSIL